MKLRPKLELGGGKMASGSLAEFRAKLKIDKEDLDNVVAQHPFLFSQVADEYTRLVSQRDKLKENTELLFYQLAMSIRQSVKDGKITKDEVEARVNLDPKYRKAVEEYHALSTLAAEWSTTREAYVQRGYMIRELCGLYASGYWGGNPTKESVSDRLVAKVRRESGTR